MLYLFEKLHHFFWMLWTPELQMTQQQLWHWLSRSSLFLPMSVYLHRPGALQVCLMAYGMVLAQSTPACQGHLEKQSSRVCCLVSGLKTWGPVRWPIWLNHKVSLSKQWTAMLITGNGPLSSKSAPHNRQEVLHWKNSRHFSKREKQNSSQSQPKAYKQKLSGHIHQSSKAPCAVFLLKSLPYPSLGQLHTIKYCQTQ